MADEFNWVEIGARLKALREGKRMSQRQVADKLKLTRKSSINNIESGRQHLSAEQLVHLARAYDVSTDYILFGDEIEAQPWARSVKHIFYTQLEDNADRSVLREVEDLLLDGGVDTRKDLRQALDLVRRAKGAAKKRA